MCTSADHTQVAILAKDFGLPIMETNTLQERFEAAPGIIPYLHNFFWQCNTSAVEQGLEQVAVIYKLCTYLSRIELSRAVENHRNANRLFKHVQRSRTTALSPDTMM